MLKGFKKQNKQAKSSKPVGKTQATSMQRANNKKVKSKQLSGEKQSQSTHKA